MHVAVVTPRLIRNDGQGRVNYEVVKRLLFRGNRVTALSAACAPDLQQTANFRWVGLGSTSLPSSLLRSELFLWQSGRWLRAHHREFDVIHANGSVTLFPSDVNAAHFVHGAWAVSEAHTARYNANAYGLYHRFITEVHRRQERVAYARAARVVAISSQVREQLNGIGVPERKIQVIWNGIDAVEFAPGPATRSTWNLPEDRFLALFAGDMRTPRKNLETILAALPSVPAAHLVVAGEVRNSPYVRRVVELDLQDRVTFVGFRRDLASLMKAVDAFVYPARYEPLGLVVLEALAAGLPVITARTTGAAALLDAECGIVIEDPNDVSALSAALNRVISDVALRGRMGAAGRSRALQHTWERMADQYVDLYEDVFARRSGARSAS